MGRRFSFKTETTEKIFALPTIDLPDEQKEVVLEMSKFGSSIANLSENVIMHLVNHVIFSLVKQQNLHVSLYISAMPQERFVFAQGVLQLIFEILNPFLLNQNDSDAFKFSMNDALKYYSNKFATR